jgi:hypothetical protein
MQEEWIVGKDPEELTVSADVRMRDDASQDLPGEYCLLRIGTKTHEP